MAKANGTYAPFQIEYLDAGNEKSSFNGWAAVPTAANIVAQTTAFADLVTATDAIVLGSLVKNRWASETLHTPVQPTNGAAREIKLLVQYQDTVTGKDYVTTVPTLDPTLPDYVINKNARDVIAIPDTGALADWITAFVGFAKSPDVPANSVIVTGLKVVGRNI